MSDDECKEILVSACTVRPHTEEELTALIRWAELARMDNMLVDMVIEGKMRVEWTPDGEPQFNSVNTDISGREAAQPKEKNAEEK